MSNSVWPHRWQPTRLPCPWDSPGKNTGVGCHFLLQCMKGKSQSEVAQSCPTLSDLMDCSPPDSSIHGISQARVLEWGAIAFSFLLLVIFYKPHLPSGLLGLRNDWYQFVLVLISIIQALESWIDSIFLLWDVLVKTVIFVVIWPVVVSYFGKMEIPSVWKLPDTWVLPSISDSIWNPIQIV